MQEVSNNLFHPSQLFKISLGFFWREISEKMLLQKSDTNLFFFKCKIYMCVHIDINMWCWFIRDTQAFVWSLCRHSYLTCDLAKTSSDPPPRWQSNKVSLCRKHRLTYLNVLCRKNKIQWMESIQVCDFFII